MGVFSTTGNMCSAVERITLEDGRVQGKFRLAVDRKFREKDGTRKADFYTVIVPGTKLMNYMLNIVNAERGDKVFVSGSLSQEEIAKPDGTFYRNSVIYAYEIEVIKR